MVLLNEENINRFIKLIDEYIDEDDELLCIENIKNNNINIEELKSNDFDILLYAILYGCSVKIINFIIEEGKYKDLNYTFKISQKFKNYVNFEDEDEDEDEDGDSDNLLKINSETTPLFMAISRSELEIVDLLLEKGANLHYKLKGTINVADYLLLHNSFNKYTLKYILKHGFDIRQITTTMFLKQYILKNRNSDVLEYLFKRYSFNIDYILHFLHIYYNKNSLSDLKLNKIISEERKKLQFNKTLYHKSLNLKRYKIINVLLDYDNSNIDVINTNIICYYKFLDRALKSNDSSFIAKVLSYEISHIDDDKLMSILKETTNNNYIKNGIVQFLKNCLIKNHIDICERLCLVASKTNIITDLIDSILSLTINDYSSSLEKLNSEFLSLLLNMAIKINKMSYVTSLMENYKIKSNIDINLNDKNGELPLFTALNHFSSDNRESDSFYYLINHDAKINIKHVNGVPSLIWNALQHKQYKALSFILKRPFTICLDMKDNYSPLIKAIYSDDIENVQVILNEQRNRNKRICVRVQYKESPFEPLVLAYLLERKNIFSLLLNNFDINDINALDSNSYSLLHYAVLKEDLDTVKELIHKGADPNLNNKDIGALEIAMAIENEEIISILLSSNTLNVNQLNRMNESSLMTLLKMDSKFFKNKSFKLECMKNLIIRKGADVNAADENDTAALFYAIQDKYDSYQMAKVLLDNGANIKVSILEYDTEDNEDEDYNRFNISFQYDDLYTTLTPSKKSPLFYAIKYNSLSIVKLLVEKGIDIYDEMSYTKDRDGTALMYAAELGHLDIFKYLYELDKDSSKFIKDNRDVFKLIFCCFFSKKTEIFQYLLSCRYNGKSLPKSILALILMSRKFDFINVLIKMNIRLNFSEVPRESQVLLRTAMSSFQMSLISYLIKNGVDPQPILEDKFYLSIIVHDFDFEFFKILVDHGLDIHYVNDNGYSFLYYSIFEGKNELRQYLEERGVRLNAFCRKLLEYH